ncbi:hypothetical protein PghCCS26_60890 [Paenibacillus glycanilyticus]|uniref:Uncharacterized protein n=1 Tax=Paenibacillus glycanilyticus TaxID=126569 RepID=A0ABQ6NYA7_9BACL|nr:hypothetical protein PghCCS26_60890 [Paenibacillus glycanilyticus]
MLELASKTPKFAHLRSLRDLNGDERQAREYPDEIECVPPAGGRMRPR